MQAIPEAITKFLGEHHIFTLAVDTSTGPWCSTCFYAYLGSLNCFVFTSEPDTRHIREVEKKANYYVSGAIALETKITGKIRGIQFTGSIRKPVGDELRKVRKAYLAAFPVARLSKLYLWVLEPDYIKMTDNRLGFGTKLHWPSNDP